MTTTVTEPETPTTPPEAPNPTPPVTPPVEPTKDDKIEKLEEDNASLKTKNLELGGKLDHVNKKYERDITSVQEPQPAPSGSDDDVFSDEGKVLEGKISSLEAKVDEQEAKETSREVESALRRAESKYPVLADRKTEFEEFRSEEGNNNLSIEQAAELFVTRNNLVEPPEPPRKGLEAPSGGGQQPPDTTMSDEDAENLRKTNYKEYERQLKAGKI